MRYRPLIGAVAGCGLTLLAWRLPRPAEAGGPTAPPATRPAAAVTIDNFTFEPATLTVSAGSTVTWTNQDDVPHTVTANDKSFDSKMLDTNGTWSYTFAAAGTYEYFCKVHPHMTGKVIVK